MATPELLPAGDQITQDPSTDARALYTTYVCDPDTVWEFAGTEESLRTEAKRAMMEGVIVRVLREVEEQIGRKVTPVSETVKIHDGRFCSVVLDTIFMKDYFYDINSIVSLTEDGVVLTEGVDFVVRKPNQIEKINGFWTINKLGIEINGNWGMGYAGGFDYDEGTLTLDLPFLPHKGVKQIIIEEVAIKCGLVHYVYTDGDGNGYQNTKTNLSKMTMDALQRYVQPVVG